jgi:outer membrane protein OmpA-like peptidoglycan-associated protein
MQNKVQYLSGDFEGYFYTNQKVTLSQTDHLPTDGAHKMVLYKGELKNIANCSAFDPEKMASRDNLYLKNISNIQLNNSIDEKVVFDKKIESFEYIVIDDVKIDNSWELNDKTYGLIKGKFKGKLQSISNIDVPIDQTSTPTPQPYPINPGNIRTVDPIKPTMPVSPIPPIPTNPTPPIINTFTNSNDGCWDWFWKILKWLFLLFLIIFLFRQCNYLNSWITNNKCCDERDRLLIENTKLRTINDSLRQVRIREDKEKNIKRNKERLQDEIDRLTSSIYFIGNKAEPRNNPENEINNIVKLLNHYPELNLEVQGHYNGTTNIDGLDLERANKIRDLILEKGIDPIRVTSIGLGNTNPIDDSNSYATDIYGNRYNSNMRVDIKITKF